MGCTHSSLGATYDGGSEVWQRQSDWRSQPAATGAHLDPARQQLYGYSEPSPLQQHAPQEECYTPPASEPPTSPQQASDGFAEPLEQQAPSPTETAEERDYFSVEQRPPLIVPVDWKQGELIGAGAFGRVYLGLNEENGELMAVKQVTISKEEAVAGRVAQHVRDLEKEVHVLKTLHHANIVRYLGTERSKDCLNIFLEYVPGGSIASLLSKFGTFRESVIRIYTRQILTGLQYLHDNKIMHRDIKGANILVDKSGLVKLADFGASKKIEDLVTIDMGVKSIKGTSYWMAPEVIKQTGHGRAADIWSVGCTIIEMATGKPPWSQFSSQVSAMFHIASAKGPPPIPEHLSPEAKDFLLRCLNRVPTERPSAARLLQHPFVAVPGAARVPDTPPQLSDAPVPAPVQQAQSPVAPEPERAGRRARAAGTPPNVDAGSADFMKLYSPMADAGQRAAEAVARSRPGSSTGAALPTHKPGQKGERGHAWADDGIARSLDGPMRQSVASHASSRYRNATAAPDPLGSPQASTSDSDYNPVEEPAWAAGASYDLGASPPASPRIPAFGLLESTAVASPARRGAKAPLRPSAGGGDDGMDEIVSFVRDKAQKDTLRLSRSFVQRDQTAGEWPGSRQRQWEAELEAELAQQRRQNRALAA